jgi:cytochrome c553
MPEGVRQCVRCHGNDAWHQPADRSHASATLPVKKWTVVCGSCHDSDTAQAHIAAQTSGTGVESCAVCHGPGRIEDVAVVHPPK